jgi:hypothetical protein
MRPFKILKATLAFGAVALLTGALPNNGGNGRFISHTVVRGETVSLLCIEKYGKYTAAMGREFLKDNPRVTDINLIVVGQVLRFRNPEYVPAAAEARDTLFSRTMAMTQGVVTYVEGKARCANALGKKELTANTVVGPGDTIMTSGNGRVECIVNGETVVRVRENTALCITALRAMEQQKGETSMNFSLGAVWTKMKKFSDGVSRFRLQMPTAIAGVHGTVYQATVDRDTSCAVSVYEGEVSVKGYEPYFSPQEGGLHEISGPHEIEGPHEVSREEWEMIVRSMQRIHIDKKGRASEATAFKRDPADSWERWNLERDKRIAAMFGEI